MSKKAHFLVSILIAFAMYLCNVTKSSNRIIFLDVGQGDGIIIQYEGKNYLIDGGPDSTVSHKIGQYINPYENSANMIILTHPHSDHIEGFLDLHKIYPRSSIIINNVNYNRNDWLSFLNTENDYIDSYLLNQRCWDGYHNIALQEALNSSFAICFMYPVSDKDYDDNVNNASIVNLVLTKNKAVWLMGDAEKVVEKEIIALYKDIDLDGREIILKAGHHCSNTSSSIDWIEFVDPDLVICSVGADNKYGHPSTDVIEMLDKKGVKYRMTKDEGDIIIDI